MHVLITGLFTKAYMPFHKIVVKNKVSCTLKLQLCLSGLQHLTLCRVYAGRFAIGAVCTLHRRAPNTTHSVCFEHLTLCY